MLACPPGEAAEPATPEPGGRGRHSARRESRRFLGLLALVGVVAFGGRVVYVLAVTDHQRRSLDEQYYSNVAVALAKGDGFRASTAGGPVRDVAHHPPLTSAALAPAAWLSGDSTLAMRLDVALFGAGVVVLIGLIAREVASERTALLAAGIAAVYPNLWMNDGVLMSEAFAAFGTAVTVWACFRMLRAPTWGNAALAGAGCAFAMLSRAELVLLVPLVVLPTMVIARGPNARRKAVLGGVCVFVASVLVAPWIGYNLTRFDRPVLLSDGDGGVLLGANCADTYSGPRIGYWNGFCTVPAPGTADIAALNEKKRERAFEYMGDHLDRLPLVMAVRVARTWSLYAPVAMAEWSVPEKRPESASIAGFLTFWALGALAVGGAVVLHRRRVTVLPLVMLALLVTITSAAFYGLVRWRLPAEIAVVVLSAVMIQAIVSRVTVRAGRRRWTWGT